nr:F-box domain, phloem protein 2-like protein [Tanacetum cinerariifolium]
MIWSCIINFTNVHEFKLDTNSGKKCYIIGARELSIAWHDDTRYWKWGNVPESRFAEVAILEEVCWLDIRGKISTAILSPRSTYVAYIVFKMALNASGLHVPAKAVVTFGGKKNKISNVYLQQRATLTQVAHTKREDGWMEIELGKFSHDDGDEGLIGVCYVIGWVLFLYFLSRSRALLALGLLRGIFMETMLYHVLVLLVSNIDIYNIVRDTLVDICFRSEISTGKEVNIGLGGGRDKPLRPVDMLLYSWGVRLDVCVDLTGCRVFAKGEWWKSWGVCGVMESGRKIREMGLHGNGGKK